MEFVAYLVCCLIGFVALRGLSLVRFVAYWICRIMGFVAFMSFVAYCVYRFLIWGLSLVA